VKASAQITYVTQAIRLFNNYWVASEYSWALKLEHAFTKWPVEHLRLLMDLPEGNTATVEQLVKRCLPPVTGKTASGFERFKVLYTQVETANPGIGLDLPKKRKHWHRE
jgi:hypothetical protein